MEKWDGPEDPIQFIRGLVSRSQAVLEWVERAEQNRLLEQILDLSDLFHPDTFLNAFRQQTARAVKCSMDTLKFVCSWQQPVPGAHNSVRIGGLLLEGCTFDGHTLSNNRSDSATVCNLPPAYISWIPMNVQSNKLESISLPLYYSSDRDRVVTYLDVPCIGTEPSQWLLCGAAIFLRSKTS